MANHNDISKKLANGSTVYLVSSEEFVMEIKPNTNKYRVKKKGGAIYEILYSTNLAFETYLEANEITKEEFEKY